MEPKPKSEKIKKKQKLADIIIICGYLGSGKTTLIKYILFKQNKYKVAVIQNEFADGQIFDPQFQTFLEMGIESPLMTDSEGKNFDKFLELPNGCICCTAKQNKDELLRAIEYLVQNEKYNLDYILVETNGLMDPSNTIQQFWVDEELKFPAKLKSIQSIIPAHRFKELQKNDIFNRQIIYADKIIINHEDQAKEGQIDQIRKEMKSINPIANVSQTSYCKIDLDDFFSYDGYAYRKEKIGFELPQKTDFHIHADKNIDFLYFTFQDLSVTYDKLEENICFLVWEQPEDMKILRCKGIANDSKSDKIISVQGVDDIIEVQQTNVKWKQGEKRISKFLFIGYKLQRKVIEQFILKSQDG